MAKTQHEVRDAVHGFILFGNKERQLIDSEPFQRLRSIHQLALCLQVYPGATHRRFEHSLGVMHTATRIFDSVFIDRPNERMGDGLRQRISQELEDLHYWRGVVRAAALLHDIGHLPFSHAAEIDLLPDTWNHERLTSEMIRGSEIAGILKASPSPMDPEDVVDVAWDVTKRSDGKEIGAWKTLLNEIITGDSFGADRIDYLLRDSHHAGVAYGRFDPDRLIDGLRLELDPETEEITLAIDIGGIHAAEALLLARYFMYTQVYLHDVRRAYDIHLQEYLQAWLSDGVFPTDWRQLIKITDDEVLAAVREWARSEDAERRVLAERVQSRKHFRTSYELVSTHKENDPLIFEKMVEKAEAEFGEANVRTDRYGPKSEVNRFWVRTESGELEESQAVSGVVAKLPPLEVGYIFVEPSLAEKAKRLLSRYLREETGMSPPGATI